MSLPIDMMREFCARHKLDESAMEEIQKIVDATLVHIGRHLTMTELPNKNTKVKKSDNRCKCEGLSKKGEPCRFYAIDGGKYCKSHQILEETHGKETSSDEKKPKLIKNTTNKLKKVVSRKSKFKQDIDGSDGSGSETS